MTSISSITNMIDFDNLRQSNQSFSFQSYASHEDMFYSGKRAIYSLWVGSTPGSIKQSSHHLLVVGRPAEAQLARLLQEGGPSISKETKITTFPSRIDRINNSRTTAQHLATSFFKIALLRTENPSTWSARVCWPLHTLHHNSKVHGFPLHQNSIKMLFLIALDCSLLVIDLANSNCRRYIKSYWVSGETLLQFSVPLSSSVYLYSIDGSDPLPGDIEGRGAILARTSLPEPQLDFHQTT